MTYKDVCDFESKLDSAGYKKIMSCKANLDDDYEWYKAFRDKDGERLYQIFFCFWNFEKYKDGVGWSVSVSIMPNSLNDLGRRDLEMSVDWSTNLNKVEKAAEMFYETIRKIDVL